MTEVEEPLDALVRYLVSDGVAHVELHRPEAFNALNTPLAAELEAAILRAAADPEVGVVLLSGAGRAFCGGGDVRMMATANNPGEAVGELVEVIHRSVLALAQLEKPVVAAVHGSVAGGGLGLTCSADLVLAGESTKFLAAYAGIAVSPDCSVSWGLPRIIGERRALEMTLLNEPLSATTAMDWGLVNQVYPDGEVRAAGVALAASLAAGPRPALGRIRRLVRDGAMRSLPEQLDAEAESITELVAAADSRARVQTFAGADRR